MTDTIRPATSPELTLEAFEAEATAFLDAHLDPRPEPKALVWGEGSDDVAAFEEIEPEEEQRKLDAAKRWRATRWDHGFGWIFGPPELGGRGLPAAYDRAYTQLEGR